MARAATQSAAAARRRLVGTNALAETVRQSSREAASEGSMPEQNLICHLVTQEEYMAAFRRIRAGEGDTDDANLVAAYQDALFGAIHGGIGQHASVQLVGAPQWFIVE